MSEQLEESLERRARIFNTQKYNMYDGPGIRSIAFFKGCPLRCKWCSNPESQRRGFEVLRELRGVRRGVPRRGSPVRQRRACGGPYQAVPGLRHL